MIRLTIFILAAFVAQGVVATKPLFTRQSQNTGNRAMLNITYSNVRVSSNNPAGVNLGAVMSALSVTELLAKIFADITDTSCIVAVNKPGEKGDASAARISVQFAAIDAVKTYSDAFIWPQSIAYALAQAGWPVDPNLGQLRSIPVTDAFTALTGVPAKTVKVEDVGLSASPLVFQTKPEGGSSNKLKPNYAYGVISTNGSIVLYDPSVESGGSTSSHNIEDIKNELAFIYGLSGQ